MAPEDKPFQLDPALFKTGNFLIDGAVKNAVKALNRIDLNKDGVADVSQFVPVVAKFLPLLVALNAVIDFEELAEKLAENPAIKDKSAFKQILLELGKIAEQSAHLLPH